MFSGCHCTKGVCRHTGCKKDPRFSVNTAREIELSNLRFAIRNGDVHALKFQCVTITAT